MVLNVIYVFVMIIVGVRSDLQFSISIMYYFIICCSVKIWIIIQYDYVMFVFMDIYVFFYKFGFYILKFYYIEYFYVIFMVVEILGSNVM